MNIHTHAKPGNRFYLTDKGKEVGRIRVKFETSNTQYWHTVPQAWIDNGWVVEKEEKFK